MAGFGPSPKEGPKLGRYSSDLDEAAQTVAGEAVKAPPLPKARSLKVETRRWWQAWVDSPQSESFAHTDWQRLLMIVALVEGYYRLTDVEAAEFDPSKAIKLLAEIRQNESLLGATHLDRLRGRIKIVREDSAPTDGATPEGVAILDDYRKALGA